MKDNKGTIVTKGKVRKSKGQIPKKGDSIHNPSKVIVANKKTTGTKVKKHPGARSWNDYLLQAIAGDKFLGLDNSFLVMAAVEGVNPDLFYEVVKLSQLDIKQVAELLNISTRTVKSYQKSGKTLSPLKGELLLKLLRLFIRGEQVFGTLSSFNTWAEKPAYGLDGATPFFMINTSEGVNLVMDEVERIAYGEFA